MKSLADIVCRRRWWIIAVWLILLGASAFFSPRLGSVTQGGGFDLPGSESWRAAEILQSQYGRGYRRVIQIIFSHPEWRVEDPRFQEGVETVLRAAGTLPHAGGDITWYNSHVAEMVSPDGRATYALINFDVREDELQSLIPPIRDIVAANSGELEAHVIGGPAFDYDLEKTSERDLIKAETYSLPVILVILVFVFGSLGAAALPLLLGVASVSLTMAALYFLGQVMALSVFVRNMVTMVGLGLGVDYSLFIVSRFREELGSRGGVRPAIVATLSSAGRAVVFSGAAVMIGLAMLTLFSFVFMRSLGAGGMVVAAASVIVAITLLPAILATFGQRINAWRVLPEKYLRPGEGRFWQAWSHMVMRRPVLFLLVSMAVLLGLAWPAHRMAAGSPGVDDLSRESDSRRGVEQFTERWGAGEVSPVYVVFDSEKDWSAWDPEFRDGLGRLQAWLAADPRVARVESLASLPLPREVPQDPGLLAAYARDNPEIAAAAGSLVNIDGGSRSTMVRVIGAGEPRSQATRQLVRDLRAYLPGESSFSGFSVMVGGGPAEAIDFTDLLVSSFPWLMAAVLTITYLVLLFLFRSILLPLKAIFMNMLSVGAAFGLLVLIFQDGWGSDVLGFTPAGGILPFVPVILFSVLFGLSMDYEVFLLSRIKEDYDTSGDNQHAVSVGLEKTGRIITSAALIMIAVFGSFALTESIVIKEFGVGLASSIFLDATVVRIILVPATMKLLGRWNWWLPAWLDRILPRFSLGH